MVAATIDLDVQGLWDNWQRSQRDHNIHGPAVTQYRTQITLGQPLPPIQIEKLVDESGTVRVRTADGRHRLTAAHLEGVATIRATNTEIARSVKEIFGL